MPNWIEGTMKVRGKAPDVYRFFSEVFTLYMPVWEPEYHPEKDPSGVKIQENDSYIEIEIKEGCHIEGSKRAFTSSDGYHYFDTPLPEYDEITKAIPVKQAWGWCPEDFKPLSDKYDVDIRLIGWEMGREFKSELECLRGRKTTYTETKYDDWNWETECPTLGG